jgi:hypothetical protein
MALRALAEDGHATPVTPGRKPLLKDARDGKVLRVLTD